jgi:hypothetical protein
VEVEDVEEQEVEEEEEEEGEEKEEEGEERAPESLFECACPRPRPGLRPVWCLDAAVKDSCQALPRSSNSRLGSSLQKLPIYYALVQHSCNGELMFGLRNIVPKTTYCW